MWREKELKRPLFSHSMIKVNITCSNSLRLCVCRIPSNCLNSASCDNYMYKVETKSRGTKSNTEHIYSSLTRQIPGWAMIWLSTPCVSLFRKIVLGSLVVTDSHGRIFTLPFSFPSPWDMIGRCHLWLVSATSTDCETPTRNSYRINNK